MRPTNPDARKDPFVTGIYAYPLEQVVDTIKRITTGDLLQ